MNTQRHEPADRRIRTLTALLGLVAFLGLSLGMTAHAQEKDKKEPAQPAKPAVEAGKDVKLDGAQWRLRNAVRLGYTRPGTPDDPTNKGKVVPIAFTGYKDEILGGTVYFMVLERVGGDRDAADTWGTGMGEFDGRFTPGRNFDGGMSPRLDTKAKYLYLYQLVNDRGLDPQEGVAFAAYGVVRSQDVAGFGLKLLVDPRYITSWGHFQGTGFNADAKDRNQINAVKQAADGKELNIRLAVSANPSILADLPQHRYMYRSPAYSLGHLARAFDVGSDVENLKKSFQDKYLNENKAVVQAAFINNELQADVEGGKEPSFVQLMYFSGEERVAADVVGIDEQPALGMFRVDWRGGNFVKTGQHSVVFGFTSDLPPVDEPIGIADAEAALRGTGIRQVIADAGIAAAAAPGTAPGTAPTPAGGAAAAGGALLPGGTFGSVGGLSGGGGGGGLGFPGGGIGAARAPSFGGGGGFGAGTGSGNGNATPTQAQGQAGAINFNATLINQQQQSQLQFQGQSQSQRNNNNHHNNVVPAPASLLLGLLGLPGLLLIWRRQRQSGATTPAV